MIKSKNYRYFTCHRYDIEKPISKVPIRYRYIDIGDIFDKSTHL